MTVMSLLDIISMICIVEGLNSFLYYLCFVVSRWSRPHRHSGGSPDSRLGWHYWRGPLQPWEHLYCRGGWNTCEWSHKSGWLISPALWVHLCTRPTVPKESRAYIHIYPKSCHVSWGQQTTERASTDAEEWFVQWMNHSEWAVCWAEYWGSLLFIFSVFTNVIIFLFYLSFKMWHCLHFTSDFYSVQSLNNDTECGTVCLFYLRFNTLIVNT